MKYFIILSVFIFGVAHAITLDDIQKNFSEQKTVRANFVQERQIKNIKTPLISKGSMLLSQEKGLWWQQTEPFVTTLILNDNEMIQRMEGQADQKITANSNPQMFQFNALMKALVKADKAVLEDNFELNFSDMGQGLWRLDLTPVTTPLNKLFNKIELQGTTELQQVILIDKQGDTTKIQFKDNQVSPVQLTEQEARYFE